MFALHELEWFGRTLSMVSSTCSRPSMIDSRSFQTCGWSSIIKFDKIQSILRGIMVELEVRPRDER
jgi:hypothetical protein